MELLTRQKRLEKWVCDIDIDQVIKLEEIIQGKTETQIIKEIGGMSSNQWRNCLLISLQHLILTWS
jgi:hypothetical protein